MKITGLIAAMLTLAITVYGSSDPIRLAEVDNGRTNAVNAGSEIRIVLEGNPTTGYSWGVASFSTNKLQQVGDAQYRPAEQSDKQPRVGVGGHFVFKFKAIESGRANLELVYRRSWETTACDKVYSVVLDIR